MESLNIEKNDPRLQLAFKLFLEGSTDKEVEEQTGINRRTFRRYRMKYGITKNSRISKEEI
ncbi:Site-specific recombinases, DNA invertase Pin homologs [Enterococcus hirae]|nr:Site-specific recombinases, DNA invertase Pin homologs [Enterococcus hirae]